MKVAEDDKRHWDEYQLSSGRFVYANNYYIGINPDMELSEGYDGGVDDHKWSPEERRELADFMIGLWTKYKEAV